MSAFGARLEEIQRLAPKGSTLHFTCGLDLPFDAVLGLPIPQHNVWRAYLVQGGAPIATGDPCSNGAGALDSLLDRLRGAATDAT